MNGRDPVLFGIFVIVATLLLLAAFAGCATVQPTLDERMMASKYTQIDYRGYRVVFGTPEQVDWICRKMEPKWTATVQDCAFPGKKLIIVPDGTTQGDVDGVIQTIAAPGEQAKRRCRPHIGEGCPNRADV